MAHFGLIDLLAWDLKSKKAGLPAYKLMGGNDPKIPAYASTVTWDKMGETNDTSRSAPTRDLSPSSSTPGATGGKTQNSAEIFASGPATMRR